MEKDRLLYTICYIDVETTGLDEDVHEITEIGAIRVNYPRDFFDGGEPEEVSRLSVKVKIKGVVDPSAGYLNHFDSEVWATEGVELHEAMYKLFPLIKEANLGGWNVDFDRRRIWNAFRRFNWQWPSGTGHRLLDVQSLARPFIAAYFREERHLRKIRLEEVARAMKLVDRENEDQLHSALFDCELAWKINDLLAHAYYRGTLETGLITLPSQSATPLPVENVPDPSAPPPVENVPDPSAPPDRDTLASGLTPVVGKPATLP